MGPKLRQFSTTWAVLQPFNSTRREPVSGTPAVRRSQSGILSRRDGSGEHIKPSPEPIGVLAIWRSGANASQCGVRILFESQIADRSLVFHDWESSDCLLPHESHGICPEVRGSSVDDYRYPATVWQRDHVLRR